MDDGRPPLGGWHPVTLPDHWQKRWPDFSGAAWYRLRWSSDCHAQQPIALVINHISMAGALYLNDSLLWRDEHLSEPFSRSWNMPRYWLLPAAALQPGENTLWLRVSGAYHDSLGLGEVRIGSPEQLWPIHKQQQWQQRHLYVINMIASLMLGCMFLIFWIMHRKESAFGWYALASLAWAAFISSTLATEPWPFARTADWNRSNLCLLALYCSAFCMFTWSFGGQHFPRLARALWATALLIVIGIWSLPLAWLRSGLLLGVLFYSVIFVANCLQFQFHAWRQPHRYNRLLALCLLFFLLIAVHDSLAFFQVLETEHSYTPVSSLITPICMFLIIAWRFSSNLKRIEAFNEELRNAIEQTRSELTQTLQREHRLEVTNTRLGERLQLAHDLHDSLGSSLMRSIITVEQAESPMGNRQFLSMLKELRDDLRQIIDNSSASSTLVSSTPGQWLAALRHRFVRLFDEVGLDSHWSVPEHWPSQPSATQLLALTRFLEEALTNVLKHSHANRLHVRMQGSTSGGLELEVEDNGIGFDLDTTLDSGLGMGMRSMRARIERIGGSLKVESQPGHTLLRVSLGSAGS